MKQLFFLATFLIFSPIYAQSWAPIGTKWTFGVGSFFGDQTGYREWLSVGDTLVGGKLCKLIKGSEESVWGDPLDNTIITYEDSNIVYWYTNNQFTTLYDFNKNVGETWTIMN